MPQQGSRSTNYNCGSATVSSERSNKQKITKSQYRHNLRKATVRMTSGGTLNIRGNLRSCPTSLPLHPRLVSPLRPSPHAPFGPTVRTIARYHKSVPSDVDMHACASMLPWYRRSVPMSTAAHCPDGWYRRSVPTADNTARSSPRSVSPTHRMVSQMRPERCRPAPVCKSEANPQLMVSLPAVQQPHTDPDGCIAEASRPSSTRLDLDQRQPAHPPCGIAEHPERYGPTPVCK